MEKISTTLGRQADSELIAEVKRLAQTERRATVDLIGSLAEFDARKLYLGEGCSSLFTYCTQVLHLSEHAAYGRIEAARAARRFPVILDLLAEGAITLTTVGLLASHLTDGNHLSLLTQARHQSKRAVEQIVARLLPLPAVPGVVRKLPEARLGATCSQPPLEAPLNVPVVVPDNALAPPATRPAVVKPLAPERYKVQFTVNRGTYEKLRRVQDLLRHRVADGDPAEIFDRALTLLLASLEKQKLAATEHPRAGRPGSNDSRYIPAAVRRAVWKRDGGQCAFVGREGRCAERGFLEFHHVEPCATGGQATLKNIELRCRAHNVYEAERFFGPLLVRELRADYAVNSVRTEFRGVQEVVNPELSIEQQLGPSEQPDEAALFTLQADFNGHPKFQLCADPTPSCPPDPVWSVLDACMSRVDARIRRPDLFQE